MSLPVVGDSNDGEDTAAPITATPIARVVELATVVPERVTWLWPGYLPAGKLVLVDGDPGDGKSTLSLDLAARLSTGSPMPDGSTTTPTSVLLLSAEDGIADTIRPRLDAAGADMTRIGVFDGVFDGETTRPVELPRDVIEMERLVVERRVGLVVVDPLMAFLGGVDSHNDQSVRRALHPLSRLADRTGATFLVVRHLNKMSGGKALYRGGGSIGIAGAARAVHLVAPDPDDDTRRLLAVVKSNLATKAPTLAYRLVSDDLHGCAAIRWEGATAHTAEDLVRTDEEAAPRREAIAFLEAILSFEPTLATDVVKQAKSVGIAERTLQRARADLGVRVARKGFGPGSHVEWSLLGDADEQP